MCPEVEAHVVRVSLTCPVRGNGCEQTGDSGRERGEGGVGLRGPVRGLDREGLKPGRTQTGGETRREQRGWKIAEAVEHKFRPLHACCYRLSRPESRRAAEDYFLAAFFLAAFLGAAFFFAAFLAMGGIPLFSKGGNRSAA